MYDIVELERGEGSRSLQVMIWSTLGSKAGGSVFADDMLHILGCCRFV
jgi:hypothetical protein